MRRLKSLEQNAKLKKPSILDRHCLGRVIQFAKAAMLKPEARSRLQTGMASAAKKPTGKQMRKWSR
jgi:hypothetical protein